MARVLKLRAIEFGPAIQEVCEDVAGLAQPPSGGGPGWGPGACDGAGWMLGQVKVS